MTTDASQLSRGDTGSRPRFLVLVPLAIAAALLLTNPWYSMVDDECLIIDAAAQPAAHTLRLYVSGLGEHEHPPLYDLILHGWLRLTGGEMHLLRVPAILFYVLGAWVLAGAAKRLAGEGGRIWVLVIVALWPYGFHFGRLAGWYSFCFLLVSLLTWAYLAYLERPTLANWAMLVFCGLLLVYANYFGWALLGLLGLDLAARDGRAFLRQWRRLAVGVSALLIAYVPIMNSFLNEIRGGVAPTHSFLTAGFLGLYNLYCAFISESVAPWFWALGIPAGIAIAACLILTAFYGQIPARRFLLYFVILLGVMTVLGIVETKRLLLIAPWLLLPIGMTMATLRENRRRRAYVLLPLAAIAGIGWYGIFVRTLYAAPHWVEPWSGVADQAARLVRDGGIAIGNNRSFFFYMTYALREPHETRMNSQFEGLLPYSVRYPGVYEPQQWLAEGEPARGTVVLVEGLHHDTPEGPTAETERSLGTRCALEASRRMVPDAGVAWKQRFAPDARQIPWRVQILLFTCPQ